ncbi:virion morphogenesis protein [Yersinia pseudotuberculosis]|uniref:phage virion morphogenesis protein n=1 Tax=Yersinia pseudotuberculosis complex TaxID=1649845 RepID=UPI00061B9AC9|nr:MULTISPECIES: phage virion morphogenesis protein [Yersinia pseudotuberculosis complex]MBO1554568.1 phage virion morphogenesis protein [Yersinia pseudotuberculosis]CNC37662.1 Mu-like prophage protein gpG [Yersinia similis]CRY70834.1 Mu-like prophage protein gpG [Yersinia pseudotuberculosis]SUQ18064.1 Mu-like prophage protein gpG [Yersinia pseudotuberculosis]BCU88717.1 virion morphogenesis protein [Yersinia pseudotuberculosis]
MLTINLDSLPVLAVLQRVQDAGLDLTPVLKNIGEILINSTKERFRTGMGPTGEKWADKRNPELAHDPRPLIGESKSLSTQINWQREGNDLVIGSTMEYGGTHQAGARKGQYGQTRQGVALPFGNIPARPFIGLSDDDEILLIESITRHIERAADPGL